VYNLNESTRTSIYSPHTQRQTLPHTGRGTRLTPAACTPSTPRTPPVTAGSATRRDHRRVLHARSVRGRADRIRNS